MFDWHAERKKLQNMDTRAKISYFFTYYAWVIVLVVFLLFLAFNIGDLVHRSTKNFVLQAFIANDEENVWNEKLLTREFSSYLGLGKKDIVVFDDSLYVQFGVSDHYIEASLAKIYAYMAAKELDMLIGPEFVVDHYLSALPMRDFTDVLSLDSTGKLTSLTNSLITSISFDGVEGKYKLKLDFTALHTQEPLYMIIPISSPNPEIAVRFLSFLTSWNP